MYKATRASVLKLFPNYNTEITAYLLEHSVDFESREDLIELTNYCNQFIDSSEEEPGILVPTKTVRLTAGKQFPAKRIMDSLYRFSEFQEAKVLWADNSSSFHPEKMNYNLFTGRMDVINERRDTVKFSQWHQAKILNLDGDVFFQDFEKGYLEILLQGGLALAVKNKFILVNDEEILESAGLLDQANASDVYNKAPVTTYDRLYQLQRTYFFITRNQAQEANKLSILKLMPRHREAVVNYINENNISLTDERHLRQLTTFCNGLLAK